MIEAVYAKGFKGLDFENELAKRNLVLGFVGSGKSARSFALTLLVTGSVQGQGVSKKAGDIFKALCSGESLEVGAKIDGTVFSRTMKLTKTGNISQTYTVNGSSTKKNEFDQKIAATGIAIADLPAFIAMSDAKKVERLFDLYPSSGNIVEINKKITATQEKLNRSQDETKNKRGMVEEYKRVLSEMDLPAGNLAEVRGAIAKAEEDLKSVRSEIADMRQKAYEYEQEKRRESEAKKQQEPEQGTLFEQPQPDKGQQERQDFNDFCQEGKLKINGSPVHCGEEPSKEEPFGPPDAIEADALRSQWISSLEKIKTILEQQACGSICVTYLAVKSELKKARG